jgi:hypothetical protein
MKYPPVVFINDTPCGFVRHMECRDLETSKKLWGEKGGCFEKPKITDTKPFEVIYLSTILCLLYIRFFLLKYKL